MAREIYIDFDNGSNSNAGTSEAAPILNGVGWTPAIGDTLYIRGTLRPSRTDTRAQFAAKLLAWTVRGVKIRPWKNQQARISGAWQIRQSEWAADTGTTWKVSGLGASLRICQVTYKYDDESRWVTLLDGVTKMPAAYLERAVDAATCRTTLNSWFYDGADVLYVNVGGSTAPATNDIECVFGNTTASNTDNDLNAITITNAAEFEVDGTWLKIDRIGANSDSDGYGIICQGTSSGKVRNLTVRDAGYHGLGCTGSGTTNVTFENCKSIGCGVSSTNFIFFSADTANVKGVRVRNCLAGVVPPIKVNGQYLAAVSGMCGFYSHTTPAASGSPRIEDVEYDGCVAVAYQPPGAGISDVAGFSTADTLARPTVATTDEVTWANYNVRVKNSALIGCTRRVATNDTYTSAIAFSRTLQVLGCWTSQNTQNTNTALNGWLSDATDTANRKSTMLIERSLDVFAFTAGGNRPMLYGVTSHNSQKRMILRGCTIIIDCDVNRDVYIFHSQFNAITANANTFRLENNLVVKIQANNVAAVLNAAGAETAGNMTGTIFTLCEGNWFYLPGGTVTWSEATANDTYAEMVTNFGVRNQISVDPGLSSGPMNPQLSSTAKAAVTERAMVPAAGNPLNLGEWNGAGCWNPQGKSIGPVNLQELMNLVLQAA